MPDSAAPKRLSGGAGATGMTPAAEPALARSRCSAWSRWIALGVCVYLALFATNSLTRLRFFSPDSMNYVDIARHMAAGHGIVQSTLGFNQPHFDPSARIPAPTTMQPPLYPAAIAALIRIGAEAGSAALLIPAICYGILLLIGWRMARSIGGDTAAWLALAALLAYFPLTLVARFAFSEPLALALAAAAWIAAGPTQTGSRARPLLAGVLAGAAFAARYAFAPVIAAIAVRLILGRNGFRRQAAAALAFGLGALAAVVPILARNWSVDGVLMPRANPPVFGWTQHVSEGALSLFAQYAGPAHPRLQAGLLAAAALGLALVGCRRRHPASPRAHAPLQAAALGLWPLFYLVFLIWQRSRQHFDPIDVRLIAPAGVPLIVLACGWIGRRFASGTRVAAALAIASVVGVSARELMLARNWPVHDEARLIGSSPTLSWLQTHTGTNDLIIGNNTMDIPFYLSRPAAVSFSPYPYTDHADWVALREFCRLNRGQYRAFYVVLRGRAEDAAWRLFYGNLFADLAAGKSDAYPGVKRAAQLADGVVYRLSPVQEAISGQSD